MTCPTTIQSAKLRFKPWGKIMPLLIRKELINTTTAGFVSTVF